MNDILKNTERRKRGHFYIKRGECNMNKKILSLLLISILVFCSASSVLAAEARATNSVVKQTDGGTYGKINITFRCTCVQETIPTNYSFASSMSAPSGISGLKYSHSGAVTLSNHEQDPINGSGPSWSKVYNDPILGGRATMTTRSTGFGKASATLSVTR